MKHEILIYNKTRRQVPQQFIKSVIFGVLGFLKLKQPVELAVLVVSEKEIKRLNKIWRRQDKVVDELSFGLNSRLPARFAGALARRAGGTKFAKKQNKVLALGEIVISSEKIRDKKYLTTLLIHSLLHLLGHHHEKAAIEAKKTERLEEKIFKHLSISLEIRN